MTAHLSPSCVLPLVLADLSQVLSGRSPQLRLLLLFSTFLASVPQCEAPPRPFPLVQSGPH